MRLIVIILFLFILSIGKGQNQMYQWQMDTYKNAEKARRWRSGQKVRKLWVPKRKEKMRRRKYTYGQPTKIRHKGVR
jgi:hypothetical protein